MKQLIEIPINDGKTILIEVDDELETKGVVKAGRTKKTIEKPQQTLSQVCAEIKSVAEVVTSELGNLSVAPNEIAVEFGVKFSAKAGVIIAAASTEATLKVSLKWVDQGE